MWQAHLARVFTDGSPCHFFKLHLVDADYLTPARSRFRNIQPSISRTVSIDRPTPSDKSLGYFHFVRLADEMHAYVLCKANQGNAEIGIESLLLMTEPLICFRSITGCRFFQLCWRDQGAKLERKTSPQPLFQRERGEKSDYGFSIGKNMSTGKQTKQARNR